MINPVRIRQAREFAHLTQTQLAEAIGLHQSAIAQFESGQAQPSQTTLEAIADQVEFPASFFHRVDPPSFPIGSLHFRKHSKLLAADRDQAYRYGQIEYEIATTLAKRVRVKPAFQLPVLTEEKHEDDYIKYAAQLARNALGLSPDSPLPHLIRTIEHCGVTVLALTKGFNGDCDAFSQWASIDGTSVTSKNKRSFIVLAGEAPGDRQRFTVAHELGHLVLHQNMIGLSGAVEDEANLFASEFLLPEREMRQQIVAPVTLTSLAKLKPVWGVSIQALLQRTIQLGIISQNQHVYLRKQLAREGWLKNEPLALPNEKPRALRQMAEAIYGEPINYQKFAAELDLLPFTLKGMFGAYAAKGETSKTLPNTTKEAEEAETKESNNISFLTDLKRKRG